MSDSTAVPAAASTSESAPATSPVKTWRYPFPDAARKEITTPQTFYQAFAESATGYFPLGINGFPHGGVHVDAGCANAFDLDSGVRCLADGEIVAYRLDDTYPKLHFTQSGRRAMYSTGFVLVRHVLALPPAPGGEASSADTQTLYSLSMHLADWSTYLADGAIPRPGWWIGVQAFRIGKADRQRGGGAMGARVRTAPREAHGRYTAGQLVGFLPEGCEVRIDETRGAWGHIAAITAGGMLSPHSGQAFGRDDENVPWFRPDGAPADTPVTPRNDWGWLYLHEQHAVTEPTGVGSVVIPPAPIPVKAGTLLGHLGQYLDHRRSTPFPPQPVRPLLHLEVFAGADFPAFLAQSRARAATLPADQRTVLVMPAGTRLTPMAPADRVLSDRFAKAFVAPRVTPDSPAEGRWVKVQPYYHMDTPYYAGDRPDGEPVWIERRALAQATATTPAWSRFPLQAQADGPVNALGVSFTRVELDARATEDRAVDAAGEHWWRLRIGIGDGYQAMGWVSQQQAGTCWQSPWAWPGFELVDASTLALTDAFQRNLVVTGSSELPESLKFEPAMQRADGTPFFQRLAQTLQHCVQRDDRGRVIPPKFPVHARLMQDAMRLPWLADELSHLILRYESEWGGNMARWEAITPLMRNARENWECELQRIRKLQWWEEIKGKVEGFPESPVVYHIHPIALVGNFYATAPKVTLPMLRKIWQNPAVSDAKLSKLATEINANMSHYKLDTEKRLAHFFAQVRVETGNELQLEETLNYSPAGLRSSFGYFRRHPAEAELYGRTTSHFANQQEIANRAYNGLDGNTELGNGPVESGDGWRYRGRGLKQTTGKYNYNAFNSAYSSIWKEENVDFIKNPELLGEMKYGVRAGVFFWISAKLYDIADQTNDDNSDEMVDMITKVINRATGSYEERRSNFHDIMQQSIFKGFDE